MELTGARRIIQTSLFATIAWAGYLSLLIWSWEGAGNGATAAFAFVAIVVVATAIDRPTLQRSLRASLLLFAAVPMAFVELGLFLAHVEDTYYTPASVAARTSMTLLALAGLFVVPAVAYLHALERRHRARVGLPEARLASR